MKTFFKWSFALALVMALVALLGGAALWTEIASQPDLTVTVNGERLPVEQIGAMHWAGAMVGLAIAAVVLVIVLPLALLIGLGLPLLLLTVGLALALAAVASVGALMFSPVIVIGLLIWLIVRTKKPQTRTNPESVRHAGAPSIQP